jgi:hypothetical protein
VTEQYGNLQQLKLGQVYIGVKRKAARCNMVKQVLTLLDSRDPDDLSATTVVINPQRTATSAISPAVAFNNASQQAALALSSSIGTVEQMPGPQSPLPKLLPPAPSLSSLATIHKKRVQFSIHDLLDIENDADDAFFYQDLKDYVGSLPSEEQSM